MRLEARGLDHACASFGRAGGRRAAVGWALILFVLAAAASAEPPLDSIRGNAAIQFFATSTKRDFSGNADARPFLLTRHDDASVGPECFSALVELLVTDLDTGWDERDGDMHWMFDAIHYPIIVAEFPHIESAAYEGDHPNESPPLDFRLTIREVTRPMTAKVTHWVRAGDRASLDAEFDVSASVFELRLPTLLGFLRVGDIINVRAQIELDRSTVVPQESNDPS
jgi:hypothetical protein